MVLRLIEKVTEIRETPLNLEKALEHYIIAIHSFTCVLKNRQLVLPLKWLFHADVLCVIYKLKPGS